MFTIMHNVDVICPIYHIDWNFFTSNIESWLNELNVNNIYMGINNQDPVLNETLGKYIKKYPEIILIDQRHHKTLGKCLSELITLVETPWFAYVHSDAQLTAYCFNIIKNLMNDDVGIIESERLHYDGVKYTYDPYYFTSRAYSGFQLIRKSAVEPIIDIIEDDFIYRNEDIIFQNICKENSYSYIKTLAMHIHQTTTTKKWTFSRKEAYDMQWRGIVKYTSPTDITVQAVVDVLSACIREFDFDTYEGLKEISPIWNKAIINKLVNKY